jgi:adenylate cyclase class 2
VDKAGMIMPIEIEKKYRLPLERRKEIEETFAEFECNPLRDEFEENIIFSNEKLSQDRSIVRIRRTDKRSTLTFKKRTQSTSDAKHQIEFETVVADPDATQHILENIGLIPKLVYEKKRTTYKFRNAEVVLDDLPFGSFMEIEGSLTAIAEAEMLLGIEDLEVEHETYPRLTSKLGKENNGVVEARFS